MLELSEKLILFTGPPISNPVIQPIIKPNKNLEPVFKLIIKLTILSVKVASGYLISIITISVTIIELISGNITIGIKDLKAFVGLKCN